MNPTAITSALELADAQNFANASPMAYPKRRVQNIAHELKDIHQEAFMQLLRQEITRKQFWEVVNSGEVSGLLERNLKGLFVQRLKQWLREPAKTLDGTKTSMAFWERLGNVYAALRGIKGIVYHGQVYCKVRDVREYILREKLHKHGETLRDKDFCDTHAPQQFLLLSPYEFEPSAETQQVNDTYWVPLNTVYTVLHATPSIRARLQRLSQKHEDASA